MFVKKPSFLRPFVEEPAIKNEDVGSIQVQTVWITATLIVLCITGVAMSVVFALHDRSAFAITALWVITLLVVSLRCPRTTSILLASVLAGIIATQLSLLLEYWRDIQQTYAKAGGSISIVCALFAFLVIINQSFRDPLQISESIGKNRPTRSLRSPEDGFTLFQWFTVSWVKPLINLGSKRQLNDEDIWLLPWAFQHRQLHEAFRELRGTVVWRLLRANWPDLVIMTGLSLCELAADYSTPVILQYLLRAMDMISVDKRPAIKFAVLMLLVRMVDAQVHVLELWFGRRAYERSRGEMITMVHEKTLNRKIVGETPGADGDLITNGHDATKGGSAETREDDADKGGLSEDTGAMHEPTAPSAPIYGWHRIRSLFTRSKASVKAPKQPASQGRILNIMKNDCYEVAQRFWEFDRLIQAPLGFIIASILLYRLLGWASLLGTGVVLVTQALNAAGAKILIIFERRRRAISDVKLQRIGRYVEAIRHLRWYGWAPAWLKQVMDARRAELNLRLVTMGCNAMITLMSRLGAGVLPVAAFYAFTALAGQELRVDIAFPALQLYSFILKTLDEIPNLITVMLNAKVAVDRIEDFMAEPDKPPSQQQGNQLCLEDAVFTWPGTTHQVLRNVTMTFPQGLSLVTGAVGSGKTALLQGLLGELDLETGCLFRPDTPVAYCSQTPWLQSMTIRDNILFTQPYDEARYRDVLEACALLPDLAEFQYGDLSPIGENGIGLSGGQKARVALARAVYSHADVLLLDDPISALDQQTAEHIVKKCLTGDLVDGRAVVLVTHRGDLFSGLAAQTIDVSDGLARIRQANVTDADNNLEPTMSSASRPDPEEQAKKLEDAIIPEKFEDEEHRVHGGVLATVYWQYVKAGRFRWWTGVILFACLMQLFKVAEGWYLKEWGEAYNRGREQLWLSLHVFITGVRSNSTPLSRFFNQLPDPKENVYPWLRYYFIIGILQAVLGFISQIFMILVTYSAAKRMFHKVMLNISNTSFRFYDVTPIGRLLNRLTSDIGTVDGNISMRFILVAYQAINWLSAIIVFATVTPAFLLFSAILATLFVYIFLTFLPTSQSLRRLEMVSLSPLMSNFGALLTGLTTVRAFCLQPAFLSRVIDVTDNFQKMDHFYWSVQGWLSCRFDMLSAVSTFLLNMLAIYSNLTPGLTAFVLVAAQRFVASTHMLCRSYGDLQLDFVSVERVVELLNLDLENPGDIDPPAAWPKYGSSITFSDLTIKYTPNAPPAISNLNLTLTGGTHTALVGRTGSGKSTLALSLLATTPPSSGTIFIDGIDISRVHKQTLRERITFLAQDPVLFPGTLRHNLDPQEDYTDAECALALEMACGEQNLSISTEIAAHGANLSQGQRQLVSLARALLRKSSIVIMDEATASVDLKTAERVQEVVRKELQERGATVVSVAHRKGVRDGVDGYVRLDKGRCVEAGGSVEWQSSNEEQEY